MLIKVQEMQFVALELALYLDTHPCDKDALNDFNCAVEVLQKYRHAYECEYGPLLSFGMGGEVKGTWQWAEEPWPWQL
jgi:spore coat protein JB